MGKPRIQTFIWGAALASMARLIWVAKSTTIRGAAISSVAVKKVARSAVRTLDGGGRRRQGQPGGAERGLEAPDEEQLAVGDEEQDHGHLLVELADHRGLVLRQRVHRRREVEAAEEVDHAAGGGDGAEEDPDAQPHGRPGEDLEDDGPDQPGGVGGDVAVRRLGSGQDAEAAGDPDEGHAGDDLRGWRTGGTTTSQARARMKARKNASSQIGSTLRFTGHVPPLSCRAGWSPGRTAAGRSR